MRSLARTLHVEDVDKKTLGALLGDLFDHLVEKQLFQPTFITDYPIELSPLTKTLAGDDRFVDRFELFISRRDPLWKGRVVVLTDGETSNAAEAVAVTYEELPAVVDMRDAVASGDGIPGDFGPFDRALGRHLIS